MKNNPYIPVGKRVDRLEKDITRVIRTILERLAGDNEVAELTRLWHEYLEYITPVEDEDGNLNPSDDLPF